MSVSHDYVCPICGAKPGFPCLFVSLKHRLGDSMGDMTHLERQEHPLVTAMKKAAEG